MTREDNTTIIREACIKANPEIEEREPQGFLDDPNRFPIRLRTCCSWSTDMGSGSRLASHKAERPRICFLQKVSASFFGTSAPTI
jgi:hypothetical protein